MIVIFTGVTIIVAAIIIACKFAIKDPPFKYLHIEATAEDGRLIFSYQGIGRVNQFDGGFLSFTDKSSETTYTVAYGITDTITIEEGK